MVKVQLLAFDKNSSEHIGTTIMARDKQEFNLSVEEFLMGVPYTRYYIEFISDEPLTDEQKEIVEDFEIEFQL
jgi:hypothetical protein